MKSSLCSLFVLLAAVSQGQILNPGFENGTENTVENWNVLNGFAGVFTNYTIKRTEGDTVISANQGNSFLMLNQKNLKTKAAITSVFQLNNRNSKLTGKFIYVPGDYTQRFEITAVYTVFKNGKRDTIMQQTSQFTTIDQDGNREYDWRTIDINMQSESFIRDGNPDTCYLSITANGTSSNNEATLLVDDLKFTSDLMAGISSKELTGLRIYPTLVNTELFIASNEMISSISIFNITGQLVFSKSSVNSLSQRINTDAYSMGTYIVFVKSYEKVSSQRFYKSF